MKIDIHVHTKKTKQGDPPTRNIDADRFHEIVSGTDVKIIAITNHNVFDLDQYNSFCETVGDDFQIWPGVELDVLENGIRAHLIIIVSPTNAAKLQDVMKLVSEEYTPDNFTISLEEVIENFDSLNPIYIAHYQGKKPDLSDDDIDFIISKTDYPNRVLREATNAVSAGIFISHGHPSIYGSDVQDWEKYNNVAVTLPDLRLAVESFEQFCLLLEKDQVAINTLLEGKRFEDITIKPFSDNLPLKFKIFNDINVFFGAKGTGKSDILDAIAKFYSDKGIICKKFEAGTTKLSDVYDIGCKDLKVDLKDYGIEYCNKEIEIVMTASEVDIVNISRYHDYYSENLTNTKAKKLKINNLLLSNTQSLEDDFEKIDDTNSQVHDFREFANESEEIKDVLSVENFNKLISILDEAAEKLEEKRFLKFTAQKSTTLFNKIIEIFKKEINKKTGHPIKPSTTGFREYAKNRIKIEKATKKILSNINIDIPVMAEYVGNLDEKGDLYCKTIVKFHDGTSQSQFDPLDNIKKTPQKDFVTAINTINNCIFTNSLFNEISDLREKEDIEKIQSIRGILVCRKCFTIDDEEYTPSSGEVSMILLHKELQEDKEIYILDEPERSLGNEYINNVIVPLIKEKARNGKKIFIATHDANIAVRTLPYNSIYRYYGQNRYKTYLGNPFSNSLIEISDQTEVKDWKDISMKTLEGGKEAFGERGKIYGNS